MIRAIRRRLYLQLYVAIVGMAVLCIAVVAVAASLLFEPERGMSGHLRRLALAAAVDLPADGDPEALAAALTRRAEAFGAELSLFDAAGARVADSGRPLPAPRADTGPVARFVDTGRRGARVRLDDGRWLALSLQSPPPRRGRHRFFVTVLVFLAAVGLGALPVARRVTRRLEALQASAQAWGEGDLSARVAIEGADEVAALAARFNWAAERVERLVTRQRRVLAHASHELRSPLTRMRMALELLDDGSPERERLVRSACQDAEELDVLIGDVLLSARLDAIGHEDARAPVLLDLAELAAEEADRIGASHDCAPAPVQGDPAMLRRMIRNLVENAAKYGQGSPVEVAVGLASPPALTAATELAPRRARLTVSDRGPGVPPGEADRVFEPFYRPCRHSEGEHGGVGLGLALVRQVAEHHGGAAGTEPRPGGGSVFWVELPAAPPHPKG